MGKPLDVFRSSQMRKSNIVKLGLLLTYGLATRHACYSPATRRPIFRTRTLLSLTNGEVVKT